jgi:hypothetical protein
MIVVTANLHPKAAPVASKEILHATITNLGNDDYGAHILSRPDKEKGIEGFEADVRVTGHQFRNGIAPLLSGLLGVASPIPFEQEPSYDILARLTLREMDEFDKRIRGRS